MLPGRRARRHAAPPASRGRAVEGAGISHGYRIAARSARTFSSGARALHRFREVTWSDGQHECQNGDRMTPCLSHLHGQTLSDVSFDPDTQEWVFTFTGQRALRVAAPWRLVFEGRIVIGCEDDGHLFGLEAPVDAKERVARAVEGQEVAEAAVNNVGDLDLRFRAGSTLQVFNVSCGYEGWQLFGPAGRQVVAQGGGRVVDSEQES